tara:strand:- start:5 stop:205 length:201 start_codon:yes stop_codon:yes gene_type:complete
MEMDGQRMNHPSLRDTPILYRSRRLVQNKLDAKLFILESKIIVTDRKKVKLKLMLTIKKGVKNASK